MPFGPTARTGLKQKSAALCTWLIDVAPEKLEIGKGYIRADLVEEIVKKVLQLKSIPQLIQDDEAKA